MAEIWPQEGLDSLLSIVPRSSQPPSYLWLGLFVSQSATTVMAAGDTRAGVVTEPSGFGYVRGTIPATAWGAPTVYPSGRMVIASLISLPTADGRWGSVNGFFLSPTSGVAQGVALFQANFDDNSQLPVATYDRVSVQPVIKFGY